ncbi:MAG: hypothetical protein F6K42_28210 [Leptolyngbya sp. SIO1D8]|nr:hypothetical protein [Leptolyngbya sp. SIO1D8]
MVVVIPLEATDRVIQLSQIHELNLPIPLSSGCESYVSPEEMDMILEMLAPLGEVDGAATLVADLQAYRDQRKPVIPCDR